MVPSDDRQTAAVHVTFLGHTWNNTKNLIVMYSANIY